MLTRPLAFTLMIFGFSAYLPLATQSRPSARREEKEGRSLQLTAEPAQAQRDKARIFDIEHERKLRALHALVENGATLSEAARLIGISRICAHRWNDYGRR